MSRYADRAMDFADATLVHLANRESLSAILTDRKSTRLNSSHGYISYAVFCSKKNRQSQPYRLSRDPSWRPRPAPLQSITRFAPPPTRTHLPATLFQRYAGGILLPPVTIVRSR